MSNAQLPPEIQVGDRIVWRSALGSNLTVGDEVYVFSHDYKLARGKFRVESLEGGIKLQSLPSLHNIPYFQGDTSKIAGLERH